MSARCSASRLISLLFVLSMLGCAAVGKNWKPAIYTLSFWHYYLYWLAYYFGAVSLSDFRGDAILMKAVSLIALAWVYLTEPLNFVSLAVVVCGFLLNCAAARVLGADRTYYGYEVADLPPRQITRFPYSWISHPMLVGNIAAFAGTLINADFRAEWWPLACTHVALNLGLLIMELAVTPQRRSTRTNATEDAPILVRRHSIPTSTALLALGAALTMTMEFRETWSTESLPVAEALSAAGVGVCISAYAYGLYYCYSTPISLPDQPREIQMEDPYE